MEGSRCERRNLHTLPSMALASSDLFPVWEASIVKATDHGVLAAIRKRAGRDRLGYGGRAMVSKDPKSEIVEDRQWLLEYIDQFDLDAISLAIGTNEFLDPPDGGGPSLAEQVRRMKEQLDTLRIRADVNVCPDCRNTFLQPFVCTTCGAQKLYDETVRSQAATIDRLTVYAKGLEAIVEARNVQIAQLQARNPPEARGVQPVRRWNAKYPGMMLEHNGELVRSGFGPYVLAEDYDRLASLLAEATRMIEGYRRAGWITNPAAQEQATDFALRARNSHHE